MSDWLRSTLEHFLTAVADGRFVGEGLAGLLLFSMLIALVVRIGERIANHRFHGWRVRVIQHDYSGTEDPPNEDSITDKAEIESRLYWEDVRRMQASSIEEWKAIRHVVSGYAWITTPGRKAAEAAGWLKISKPRGWLGLLGHGCYVIDLPKLPSGHLDARGWLKGRRPRGWSDEPDKGARAPRRVFISGHDGAHDWARARQLADDYRRHLDDDTIKGLARGDIVIGSLPATLIARLNAGGVRYVHLRLDIPEDRRRKDLTGEDMDAMGARLVELDVDEIGPYNPPDQPVADTAGTA